MLVNLRLKGEAALPGDELQIAPEICARRILLFTIIIVKLTLITPYCYYQFLKVQR